MNLLSDRTRTTKKTELKDTRWYRNQKEARRGFQGIYKK
jgi:hypothetical protein